jgi:hypothetical protein
MDRVEGAVHPQALDRRLAFDRHAERGEKSDSGCEVVNDDADVVQSLDRHVPSIRLPTSGLRAYDPRSPTVASRVFDRFRCGGKAAF